jgi:serine/threonine-protein kinase
MCVRSIACALAAYYSRKASTRMTSFTNKVLAKWIRQDLEKEESLRREFPGGAKKVCPGCGVKQSADRVACTDDNTVLVPTLPSLGHPELLIAGLRDIDLSTRFATRHFIDEGRMCWVFEGVNVETVEPVAIKILRHELASDPKTNNRFLEEARMWQELKHENILSVLETGLIPEFIAPPASDSRLPWGTSISFDRPYIVMEYIKGANLSTIIRNYGVLDSTVTIRIAMAVLEALHLAHRQEIVHRDLKPSNIFLVPDGNGEIGVKVSDFGLAQRMFRQIEWTPQTTKTGSVYGDPSYLSPEYLIEQKTTPLSDLYALGCVMFECLSGKPPFIGQHEFHTMIRHVKDKPDALPRQIKVPDALEKAIYKAIEREPDKRFESAEHMRMHLERIGESIHAQ